MDYEEVPIQFNKALEDVNYDTQKLEFTKKDKTTRVKQEFPVYDCQENLELLCKLVKTFSRYVTDYDLFEILGEAEVSDRFRQCLGGDALDTWDNVVTDKKESEWEGDLAELMRILVGPWACDIQKAYMHETRKPSNMSMRSYALRLKTMNSYLPILGLKTKEKGMTEEGLVKIIARNIPRDMRMEFYLAGEDQCTTVAEALHFLIMIETKNSSNSSRNRNRDGEVANKKNRKQRNGRGAGKNKGNGSGKSVKNPCKLPGHSGHEWSDCFYNPKSKSFKGVARTPKDYDKNGKLKKNVREREEANRTEKEKK